MNALSEQCEVLRLWAKQLREGEPILASDLREAADTILNLRDTAQQAQAENAKLRKLMLDIYVLCWHGMDCTKCPWFDECDTDGGCPWLSIMHDHMHELGVEVDG